MKILNKTKEPLLIAIVSLILLSGIFAFAPKKETKEISSAVPGSPQSNLTPSTSDLFDCGGRDDCLDDICPIRCDSPKCGGGDCTGDICDASVCNFSESQHKYVARAYDKFGFPLSGVKYKWTKDDGDNLFKFRDISAPGSLVDTSEITAGETDQEIYVQPNESNIQNGTATVNVLGYLGSEEAGKTQSIDVNLYFCLNSWPSTAAFPFSDTAAPPTVFTNFETFYCRDRGSATNPGDDYSSLRVIERGNKVAPDYSYLCSGGGGNNLKCDTDYYINYNGSWSKGLIAAQGIPTSIKSPDSFAMALNRIFTTEGFLWAYHNGTAWSSGDIESASYPELIPVWPDGPVPTVPLKPTAIALNGIKWILIEGNFYATSAPVPSELPTSTTVTTLAEAGWPTDVQFPDDVAWWSYKGNDYFLALKDNYYRIYSNENGGTSFCNGSFKCEHTATTWGSCTVDSDCRGNKCNSDSKCETQSGRIWGSCNAAQQCYWGETFSLYSARDWPTNIDGWQNNIKFPVKTIGLANNNFLTTSSCEYSNGICLLKEFLLIANPACSDGIDNDNDQLQPGGGCDWQNNICGAGINKDPDCASPDDNSESGTCDDGIDNDNDGSIDYPADFSCDSYSDIEEEGCVATQCCDNTDNDSDGLVDQIDSGCDSKADNTEANSCADGIDNDGDGLIDLFDPGCSDSADNDEKGITQCDDGIDNDGNGSVDYPADFGCEKPGDDQELTINTETAKVQSDLVQLYNAIKELEADTGLHPNHLAPLPCLQDPEIYLNNCNAGIVCDGGFAGWNGPYMAVAPLDPWGKNYFFDPDYWCYGGQIGCLINPTVVFRAILSVGPDGTPSYGPASDDLVLVLCKP